MKTLMSLLNGAVLVQEQAGDFYLAFDASIGGGVAAGIIEGQGKIKIGAGSVGLKLAEAWINAHIPDAVKPFAEAAEAYLNAQVASM